MAAEEARQVEVAPQALSGFLFTLNANKKTSPEFLQGLCGRETNQLNPSISSSVITFEAIRASRKFG